MPKFINIALTEAQLSVIYTALGDRYSYFSGLIRMETDPSKKEVLRSVRNDVRKVHNLVLEALNSPFTSHTDDNPPPSKEGDAPAAAQDLLLLRIVRCIADGERRIIRALESGCDREGATALHKETLATYESIISDLTSYTETTRA